MFPNNATAERWFVQAQWPEGVRCPECDSHNVQERPTRKPQPYRCRDCRKDFSVKTGTLMHASNLELQKLGAGDLPALHRPQRAVLHEAPP
ncbi:MAG: IS1 family transposase [Holophagales bacterium]|nr:IS1 family transposase [Holophagales bacterium]